MARRRGEAEVEAIFARTRPAIGRHRAAAEGGKRAAVHAMSQEVDRCRETLAHHLLDLPLWHVLYFWTILRLKYRPWRILVPASLIAVLLYRAAAGTIPNLWAMLAGGLGH